MIRWFCIFTLSLFFLGSIVGCSEEPTAQPVAKAPKAAAKPPAQSTPPPAPESVGQATVDQEQKFVYQSDGRRDPFVPLTLIRTPINEGGAPLTPLQRFELSQYRLTAVLVGIDEPRAVVSAPDKKTYILKEGMKIGKNGGVIIEITDQVVLVEEKFYDFSGNVRTSVQEILVPKR